jgi:hypothetical protein
MAMIHKLPELLLRLLNTSSPQETGVSDRLGYIGKAGLSASSDLKNQFHDMNRTKGLVQI